jgi:hypothetical protein
LKGAASKDNLGESVDQSVKKGLDCVLKQSDINAAAIEEVTEEIGKASKPFVP